MANHQIRHRAKVHTDYQPAPRVWASESRLSQVFLNLLLNAAHAIPDGHADSNWIEVVLTSDDDGAALVKITDSGQGMSSATIQRLFTPFFTTKPLGFGTGLGLSICQRIVSELEGSIRIESEPARGTSVWVTLPASRHALAAPTIESEAEKFALIPRGRILVIDDEPAVGRVMQRLLAPDHDTVLCTSAKEGLEQLRNGHSFDVILCDLMMPDMTGMDLYARLLEASPETARRIIFLTGGGFTPRAAEFLETTAATKLHKPVEVDTLRAAIARKLVGTFSSRGS